MCDAGDDDDDEDMPCDDDATSPGVRAPFIADSSTGAWKSKNSALCTREVLASSGVIFCFFCCFLPVSACDLSRCLVVSVCVRFLLAVACCFLFVMSGLPISLSSEEDPPRSIRSPLCISESSSL